MSGWDAVARARDELQALYQEWFARIGPDPGDFFDRVLAPDWVYIDYNGVQRGKADYVPYIAGVPPGAGPRSPRDLHVRLFGEIAVADGSYAIRTPSGTETVLRFTSVWLRGSDGCVALAHHTSAVADSST